MNVGIIAEYNPFHKGHGLHIANTRALTGADNITAVMSGSFTQRGEPAILDKFSRTRAALLNGADMVLELPVEFATGAADVFALGGVDTLNKSGIVDMLSFGTESGDIDIFKDAARLMADETDEFKAALRTRLDSGESYACARAAAIGEVLSRDVSFLSQPNNILALEYLKALIRLKSDIKPVTVKREGGAYNERKPSGELSSAAAVRHSLKNGEWDIALSAVPQNCHDIVKSVFTRGLPDINSYSGILKYILLTTSPERLAQINDVSEGLENRILSFYGEKNIELLADSVKSKRYTHSKVRRALLHIILGITKDDIAGGVKYIRVLGFKRDKQQLVSELTQKASVPVITNVKNAPKGLMDREMFATDMYCLPLTGEKNKDLTEPMVII